MSLWLGSIRWRIASVAAMEIVGHPAVCFVRKKLVEFCRIYGGLPPIQQVSGGRLHALCALTPTPRMLARCAALVFDQSDWALVLFSAVVLAPGCQIAISVDFYA
eukprot:14301606-Ditylum_brightwellii.AAC.1